MNGRNTLAAAIDQRRLGEQHAHRLVDQAQADQGLVRQAVAAKQDRPGESLDDDADRQRQHHRHQHQRLHRTAARASTKAVGIGRAAAPAPWSARPRAPCATGWSDGTDRRRTRHSRRMTGTARPRSKLLASSSASGIAYSEPQVDQRRRRQPGRRPIAGVVARPALRLQPGRPAVSATGQLPTARGLPRGSGDACAPAGSHSAVVVRRNAHDTWVRAPSGTTIRDRRRDRGGLPTRLPPRRSRCGCARAAHPPTRAEPRDEAGRRPQRGRRGLDCRACALGGCTRPAIRVDRPTKSSAKAWPAARKGCRGRRTARCGRRSSPRCGRTAPALRPGRG